MPPLSPAAPATNGHASWATPPASGPPEKVYELRQQRAKLSDDARVILERAEKENRALSADEDAEHKRLCDETFTLAKRISTLDRQAAADRTGLEVPSERKSLPLPHEDPANTHGKHVYSMMRAAKCFAEKRAFDGIEKEVSDELAHRTGKSPQGFLMPYTTKAPRVAQPLPGFERRALDSVAGVGSIPTILEADWIELLRNAMKVKQAGAREILDLQGKFAIPRQTTAATAYWVAESGAPTASNQVLDQVLFTPHTIGAFTDISRRFFELTIIDSGEEFVKQDLTAVLARGVDLAALNGAGTATVPLGILANPAILSRQISLGANGGPPTWAAMVDFHTQVARTNAIDLGPTAYMMNADGVGTLSTTPKIGTTYPVFLMEDGLVYGKMVYETQQIPSNYTVGTGTNLSAIIYGVWNQLILAFWSGIDILVDPYTGSSSGTVRIVALQDCDVQPRHPEAFAITTGLVSNQP